MSKPVHGRDPVIVASAATVAAGMLCLVVAEMDPTKGLGPVNAIGIGIGLLAMLTLLPALLVIFGRWIFWPARPAFGSADPTSGGLWARVGNAVARRARLVWIVTAVILGAVAYTATGLEANRPAPPHALVNKPDPGGGGEGLPQAL